MAGHELVDGYLAGLARRVPRDVLDELADGLIETWHRHQRAGLGPAGAAEAAIAEFGTVDQVTAAFVKAAPGRLLSRLLLANGPLAGACWGVSLTVGHAWTWPIDAHIAAGYLLLLLAVVAALMAAATARYSYRCTRLGTFGGCGLTALDIGMIAATLLLAPTLVWPMAIAIPASLTRIAVVLSRLTRHAIVG